MGCGASTASPPAQVGVAKSAPATLELILVLGIDEVSGKSDLCQKLCKSLGASGRMCHHIELQALLKAEVAAETEVGIEIASLVGQGKIVPAALSARVIQAKLHSSPPGVCFLEGYPPSGAALKSMLTDTGYAPRLALMLDLTEEQAKAKLASAGADEQSAQQSWLMFKAQSNGLIEELEGRSILHRIDASKPQAECLSTARALVDSVTRGTPPAAEQGSAVGGARLVLVMGGPGAGKATQCAKLAAKYGCAHLHLAALMQNEMREETETGRAIAEMLKGGKIVPAHLYLALLKSAVAKLPAGSKPCLLDGFPRSLDALALLEEHMGACKRTLLLEASDGVLEQRLLQREQDSGRAEDAEVAKRKIRSYNHQTKPAIASLQTRGLVSKVDASGSKEDVFKRLCKAYEAIGI